VLSLLKLLLWRFLSLLAASILAAPPNRRMPANLLRFNMSPWTVGTATRLCGSAFHQWATYLIPKMTQTSRTPKPRVSKVGIHIQLNPPIHSCPIIPPLIVAPPAGSGSTWSMRYAMVSAVEKIWGNLIQGCKFTV